MYKIIDKKTLNEAVELMVVHYLLLHENVSLDNSYPSVDDMGEEFL